jgi:hypothetical protein
VRKEEQLFVSVIGTLRLPISMETVRVGGRKRNQPSNRWKITIASERAE